MNKPMPYHQFKKAIQTTEPKSKTMSRAQLRQIYRDYKKAMKHRG